MHLKKKELLIVLSNPQNCKVTIEKDRIGKTLEKIEIKQVNDLMDSDQNWDQILHVSPKWHQNKLSQS